jgi:ubiquinone/menaquinone biosynthesis C-methylase UbiE
MSDYADAALAEIERIRSENERRSREIPADFYGWNRSWNQFRNFQIQRACLRELAAQKMFPLANRRVLDIGCGSGAWLLEFAKWGASPRHLFGIDLDSERVRRADELLPAAQLECGDARRLPWPDESMDITAQFTVFTSMLNADVRDAVAREMLRVTKQNGLILWYDFRVDNPSNANVRGIGRAQVRSLFPDCSFRFRQLTLVPPLARMLVRFSWPLAFILESLRFLDTHYLVAIRKNPSQRAR